MSVENKHKSYNAMTEFWTRCRDVVAGEDAVKAAGTKYLPKLSGQTLAEYEAYKARALFYNATARTIEGLTGMVLASPPDATVPKALEPHRNDVTLSGEPFAGLVNTIVDDVLEVGRFGILLDWSDNAKRPYWVPFTAENICNWDVTYRAGDAILTFLVLHETVEKRSGFEMVCVGRYRVLNLVEVDGPEKFVCQTTVYDQDPKTLEYLETSTVSPERNSKPLNFIPFVCFGPKGVKIAVEKPTMLDLVNVNLSHFRSSADLEHGRHYTALPTPVVTGSQTKKPLKIGSSTAWVLPEPGSDAKYLEFTGQGLSSLEGALKSKEQLMQILGARLLEPQKVAQEAFATVKMRHSGDTSVLQNIVAGLNLGLTTLWRWHAWWARTTDNPQDPTITAGVTTSLTPEPDVNLNDLLMATEAGRISWMTYYANLERAGLTRPGVTAEQEREQLLAEGGADPLNKTPTPTVEPPKDPDEKDPDDEDNEDLDADGRKKKRTGTEG